MHDTSLWYFLLHAGLVVKAVLFILFAASILSWTIIIQRTLLLINTRKLMREFESIFWSGETLSALLKKLPPEHSDMARVFHAGFNEYQSLKAKRVDREVIVESVKRAMQIAERQSLQALESNVSVLATIGSTAPYLGLFGTVWGILISFQALGGVQQATIAMVAPGISEALIATAMGLFAAIPAVIGYNRLTSVIAGVAENLEIFQEKLLGLFQRQTAIAAEEAKHEA